MGFQMPRWWRGRLGGSCAGTAAKDRLSPSHPRAARVPLRCAALGGGRGGRLSIGLRHPRAA